jgi:CRP/FNR family transcriptional regulator, cyclic AMP receptor protein
MDGELVVKRFAGGDVMFKQDSPGSEMYVIRSGKVRIYREHGGQETTLAALGPGDFLGEMAMLTSSPRAATAQAVSDVEVRVVDDSELERCTKDPFVRDLLKSLSTRLRDMDAAVEKASTENEAVREGLSHIHLVRHRYT